MVALSPLAGCVVYEPVPVYPPPGANRAATFDRAWNAALYALRDTGVQVSSSDRSTGTIRGRRDKTDVLMSLAQQSDGSIRVDIEARTPQSEDTGLARLISAAYRQRMAL